MASATSGRYFLSMWLLLAIFPGWGRAESPPAKPLPVKPIRALLVCGGCCHDYDVQQTLIGRGLEERAHIEVTIVQQGGRTTNTKIPLYENADWYKDYDVVLHDECFADVADRNWTDRILAPHRAGLPAVVIHCAMHCYRDGSDEWFKFCGVTSRRHGAAYPHEVLNHDPQHPIMQKFGAAWANPAGELYWIEKIWPTAHPLGVAKNKERGTEEVCVWTNQYEKGRVFGTTLGHHNETVSSPTFLDMLTRGTLWACDKLNDDYLKPAKPKLVPVNIGENKPAKATSEETGKNNFAKNGNDGRSDTRWCANGGQANEQWQVDLQKPQTLTGCRIVWEDGGSLYRYRIEGSPDGKDWKILHDGSQNKQTGITEDFFQAEGIQHVRITFLGNLTGKWGSFWEAELYGTEKRLVTPTAANTSKAAEYLKEVKVPEGFKATLFAAPPAVNYPVFVAAAPNGDVYVAVDKNGSLDRQPKRGSILRLRDLDHDGQADEVRLFVPDVDSPRGIVWDHDRLYVLHPPHMSAFIDEDGDGRSDRQEVLVKDLAFTFKDRPADHTSNGVTLGIDGWLYLAIGDFGFMQAQGADGKKLQFRGGGVVRVRPDGSGLEIYSKGTRNILEVALDPYLNGFTRDNTNDGGGWDIRLHHFSGLEHHGYPSLFKNFGEEIVQPLGIYGGGSGCGALFLDEPGFPEGFGHAAYTADWGRDWVYRHRFKPQGASFEADQTEFVRVPRVTDLDVDASSNLYIASWKGATFTYVGEEVGYLVRVTPEKYKAPPVPDYPQATSANLIAELKSPSHRHRLAAQRELVRRGLNDETKAGLMTLVSDEKSPLVTRIAALFALKLAQPRESTAQLVEFAKSPALREYALRALTDDLKVVADVPVVPITQAVSDPSPRVRRQAAVSLARLGKADLGTALAKLLADSDPLVAHTSVQAFHALQAPAACFAILDDPQASPARITAACQALQGIHTPAVVNGLIMRFEDATDAPHRHPLWTALCRLVHREGPWKGESWGTRPDTSGPYYSSETWELSDKILATLQQGFTKASGDEATYFANELERHKLSLSGTADRLLALAYQDDRAWGAALNQLLRSEGLPNGAQPLLLKVATSNDQPEAIRSRALLLLTRTQSAEVLPVILRGLNQLKSEGDALPARDAYLRWPALDQFVDALAVPAANLKDEVGVWATAGLLVVAERGNASPEAREHAQKELERAWDYAPRRIRVLQAIPLAKAKAWNERLLLTIGDPDPKVADAGKKCAEALKLQYKPHPFSNGPKIEGLAPEQVVAEVVTQTGDKALGELLFTRQNCVTCHTVRPQDPPRGPFLANISNTYRRKDLAESILFPSKTLAQGFVTQVLVLNDGRQITGFIVQEAADKVILRDKDGQEIQVPASDIEERVKQTVSMMPEGLVKNMTVKEFASLLDYLESLAKK